MQLEVSDLSVARGGLVVLEGLNFSLAPGRALVLRGANGIGKTTLLRTIAGLQPAVAGEISAPPETLAYASHADGLKAALSARENLQFWAAIYGFGAERVETALAALQLSALASRRAAHLSAGQKRRLGLARMLVTGRPVWLFDEPTVSLDAAAVALFADVLRGHFASGGSALIATHIELGLPEAESLDLTPWRAARGPEARGQAGAAAFDPFAEPLS
ncbi:heme ABC exporter ATP-binding protein CcmA [Pseudogemmobacter faecipullorum]|uniref:Heme ABC exporter ATP-binding protein CcmA n=1 Tax=Pseudogemmobacter faecipullorum TaxID=2755041 RepID=A0ABS8CKU0_9RHOB|nr:heme ABC exporter ATP-binding protein CcmA [Pseudogemmobacter faecipullorum]MCB5409976.1 heme ABC exporter ATP-binding protein CcmA [Pseudogemmobacter faecipullorum]